MTWIAVAIGVVACAACALAVRGRGPADLDSATRALRLGGSGGLFALGAAAAFVGAPLAAAVASVAAAGLAFDAGTINVVRLRRAVRPQAATVTPFQNAT